ncbi:MAG TPA: hypothetical protein VLH79_09195 [Chthonomonadales bacterium]|nr:hypothetical protein [Chthonomonadales bacterium]
MKLVVLAAAGTLAVLGAAAMAGPEMVVPFHRHYNIKPDSRLGKLPCLVCHLPDNVRLGPYGMDMQRAMRALKTTTMTPAVLRRIERLDSDRDGVNNLAELRGDSSPNDRRMRPARPARPAAPRR